MAELHVRVGSASMPISTEFVRFFKGLEHFYYVIVLTSLADANQAGGAWRAWLAAGFNPALRIAPPVDSASRLKVDSRPGVGGFEVTLSSANQEALDRLRTLLQDLEAARKSLRDDDDKSRLALLIENQAVKRQLLQPLKDSLARSQIAAGGVDAFMAMIYQGLLAIAAPELTSITVLSA